MSNDSARPPQIEQLLGHLTRTVCGEVGDKFLFSLVEFLAQSFDVKYALIAEVSCCKTDEQPTFVQTLAVYGDGTCQENFEYLLEGTPCKEVTQKRVLCSHEKDVALLYPKDKFFVDNSIESYFGVPLICSKGGVCGLLVLLDIKPLKNTPVITDIMSIVSHRAAAEIERLSKEKQLQTLSKVVKKSYSSVVITDPEGIVEYVNKAFLDSSGYSENNLLGKNLRTIKSGEHTDDFYKRMWFDVFTKKTWHGEICNRKKSGELYWEKVSIFSIENAANEITNFVGIKEDITKHRTEQARLRLAATIYDNASEAIYVTGIDGKIELINPAFTDITGYNSEDVTGRNPEFLFSNDQSDVFYDELINSLKRTNRWEGEVKSRTKNGDSFTEWLTVVQLNDYDDNVAHTVHMFSDITEHVKNEALLYRQANYDSLTGLPNKILFMEHLTDSIRLSKQDGTSVAVMFINLDGFKWINDTFGRSEGDDLLRQVGGLISSTLREPDTVSRLISDEFTVILNDVVSSRSVEQAAEKILQVLSSSLVKEGKPIAVSASIGISMYPTDADNAESILHNAGSAMHKAKINGRSHYQFFTQEMNKDLQNRLRLEQDLRRAIKNNEFEVYYQPIIDSERQVVIGAEALIRWNHPTKGLLFPDSFIAFAEETKLIVPIGRWVLETVCQHVSYWDSVGFSPSHVSVNLSPCQCLDIATFQELMDVIVDSGVNPEQLVLEITESLMIDDREDLMDILKDFRAKGVRLSIDDFGTGYSSLSYIKRFPVDILKIDRSFVENLPGDLGDLALVKAIVTMSKSLNLDVVAEGVETYEQMDMLRSLGCEYAQGYYYSKPIPAYELLEFISNGISITEENHALAYDL
ncbi:MAG: EAL domain-containing protein [Porticoccus sp.]